MLKDIKSFVFIAFRIFSSMDRNYASRRYIYLAGVNYDHDIIMHDSGLIIKEWKLVFIQPYSLVTEDILAGKAHKIVAGPRPTSEGVHPGCGLACLCVG